MASICSYIWMLSHPGVTLFINIRRIRRVALVGVCVAFIDLTSEIVSQLPIKCFVPGCQTWPPIPLPTEASHWSLDYISGFVTYEGMTKGRINCNREILHQIWIYTCFSVTNWIQSSGIWIGKPWSISEGLEDQYDYGAGMEVLKFCEAVLISREAIISSS